MQRDEIKEQWLRQNEKVCLCMAIPRKRFIEAINSGANSVAEVNKIVGSGSGECKGERCRPKIEELLNDLSKSPDKK